MDQNIVDLIIAAADIIADGIITGIIGTVLLNKSKKELQQMQHDHEEKMQQRQQEFEKSLQKQQEEREEKDRIEKDRKNAIEKYLNGMSAFLADSSDDEAFALATSAYSIVLEYAPKQLHQKMTDLHDLIIELHQTDNGYDENGTVNLRAPLEKRVQFLFAGICREWIEFQSISIPKQDICDNSGKGNGDHKNPVEQRPLPEEKPLEFVF